ncbi:MAG: hypothetical protein C5B46_01000 [Proteobacteria bacterium]|nr:MAG: hypothetical protein C5B46_01000 [Pseudomonadota bacterium]
MNSERVLMASIVLLALGNGLIFGYCHDSTVGFNAAHPASAASLQIVINTNGWPAMVGPVVTVLGILLLLAALAFAVVKEVSQRQGTARTGGALS